MARTQSQRQPRPPDPTGIWAVAPAAGLFLLAGVIVALVLFGGWVAFGFAIALTIVGVFALSRFVAVVGRTSEVRPRPRRGLSGIDEDLAVSDEAHETLTPHDVPADNPAHSELVRRRDPASSEPARRRD